MGWFLAYCGTFLIVLSSSSSSTAERLHGAFVLPVKALMTSPPSPAPVSRRRRSCLYTTTTTHQEAKKKDTDFCSLLSRNQPHVVAWVKDSSLLLPISGSLPLWWLLLWSSLFMSPLPAMGATLGGGDADMATAAPAAQTTTTFSSTSIVTSANMFDNNNDHNNNHNDVSEGIAAVTQSELGRSVRRAVMGGAQVVDQWDLKWERWSDSLRDEAKCDPRTNRRMFDNGVRRDGTRIGNPVLGALCTPEPMHPFRSETAHIVREAARKAALSSILRPSSSTSSSLISSSSSSSRMVAAVEVSPTAASSVLDEKIAQVQRLVGPSFARAMSADEADQQVMARQTFNQDLYTDLRAMGELLPVVLPKNSSPPTNVAIIMKETVRSFQLAWGEQLLTTLAPTANRNDFTSPFPLPSNSSPPPYDVGRLLDALGRVSAGLNQLQAGGLIGHWEISIPEDDDWNVITIAIDDDTTIGGQILSKERGQPLDGSPVNAMVRAAMEDTAKVSYYKMDVFFIDPTTTKQELYNPTQLLISLSDLLGQ